MSKNKSWCSEFRLPLWWSLALLSFSADIMSKFNASTPKTIFASKTTFDALAVDSGEESEEEERPSDIENTQERLVVHFRRGTYIHYALAVRRRNRLNQLNPLLKRRNALPVSRLNNVKSSSRQQHEVKRMSRATASMPHPTRKPQTQLSRKRRQSHFLNPQACLSPFLQQRQPFQKK